MPTRNSDLLSRIAANLRGVRERRGLTREQLGATTDIDPQMIKRIESGRANPALVVLSRLASALAISVALMMGGEAVAEPPRVVAESEEAFDSQAVGNTIVALRRQRHVSRRALAKLIDLRTGTLMRYETGRTAARILALEPIAEALSIDCVELVRQIEQRGRVAGVVSADWREQAPGAQCRLVSSTGLSDLWEWRLAPGAEIEETPSIGIAEDTAIAVRGEITVTAGDATHVLRGGNSLSVPQNVSCRFANSGRATARMMRFQVRS